MPLLLLRRDHVRRCERMAETRLRRAVRGGLGWLTAGAVAAAAVGGKVLFKGAVVMGGAVAGRAVGGTVAEYLRDTPEGRESRRGFESVTPDADALLRPYRDSSASFFQQQGARAVAFALFALSLEEQEEVLGMRRVLANGLDDATCEALFWSPQRGKAQLEAAMATLPETTRLRAHYLTGRGMARLLRGETVTAPTFANEDSVAQFYVRYATEREIELLATSDTATSAAHRCGVARLLFDLVRRPRAGSDDRARATRWAVALGVTP
jgi:hypothetical protein